ncbi:MAG: nucleotidyltransferase domain-containing protein [Anaerolineales bacterium]
MLTANRDQVVALLQPNRTALRQFEVQSLDLFGSAARNTLRRGSDVDLHWAEAVPGRFAWPKVDLVTPKAIRPLTRPSIEKDLHIVFNLGIG